MANKQNAKAGFAGAPGSAVLLRDGRSGKVESVSHDGRTVWIRDEKGNLSSADTKTGWSGDGNWINDVKPNDQAQARRTTDP